MRKGLLFRVLTSSFCLVWAGCCSSTPPFYSFSASESIAASALNPKDAAELAAKLANEELESVYRIHTKPFKAAQYPVARENSRYRWGKWDPAGKGLGNGGLSALVTFDLDGTNPKVEIYMFTDMVPAR